MRPPTTSPRRRPVAGARTAVALAAGLVGTLLCGACTGPDEPRPTPSASAAPAPPQPGPAPTDAVPTATVPTATVPTLAQVRAGTALTSGDVVVRVLGATPVPAPLPDADGSARLDLPAGTGGAVAWLAADDGATLDVRADGTVLVVDGSGAGPTAGLSTSGAWPARLVGHGDVVEVRGGDGPQTLWLAAQAVADARWDDLEGGRSLAVTPTAWARQGGAAARELVSVQLVALQPEAASESMQQQLVCHQVGAPDKATWNLEPWRPAVGLLAMAAARCNPTG